MASPAARTYRLTPRAFLSSCSTEKTNPYAPSQAAPPYQKIGARYLVERCRYESAAAARKALKRYQAMETKTEDDLKYKSDRINELEDILKEIVQMQKEVAEKRAREKEPKSCFTAAEIALPTQEQQPGTWQWALPKM